MTQLLGTGRTLCFTLKKVAFRNEKAHPKRPFRAVFEEILEIICYKTCTVEIKALFSRSLNVRLMTQLLGLREPHDIRQNRNIVATKQVIIIKIKVKYESS